jgi:nicotinamide mononucleotide transporter
MVFVEWLAVIFNLVYLFYARKKRQAAWLFGGLGSLCYIFINYNYHLYQDMLLQVFYVAAAVMGWISWKSQNGNYHKTKFLSVRQLTFCLLLGIILSLLSGFLFYRWQAGWAYWDSAVTVWSLIATGLTIRHFIENWPLWIIINLTASGMYFQKELLLTSLLYLIFTDMAIEGWIIWKKQNAPHAA